MVSSTSVSPTQRRLPVLPLLSGLWEQRHDSTPFGRRVSGHRSSTRPYRSTAVTQPCTVQLAGESGALDTVIAPTQLGPLQDCTSESAAKRTSQPPATSARITVTVSPQHRQQLGASPDQCVPPGGATRRPAATTAAATPKLCAVHPDASSPHTLGQPLLCGMPYPESYRAQPGVAQWVVPYPAHAAAAADLPPSRTGAHLARPVAAQACLPAACTAASCRGGIIRRAAHSPGPLCIKSCMLQLLRGAGPRRHVEPSCGLLCVSHAGMPCPFTDARIHGLSLPERPVGAHQVASHSTHACSMEVGV